MDFIVERDHVFRDSRGRPMPKTKGDTAHVPNRHVARELLAQGIIRNPVEMRSTNATEFPPIPSNVQGWRVAFVIHTSPYYSGGRIHLFQYAWNMARAGADVLYVSESVPKWAADYPNTNITYLTANNAAALPKDIDLLVTDGKDKISAIALDYRRTHTRSKLIVMNFETPNWMQEFDPKTAGKMQQTRTPLMAADVLMCNSEESETYLRKYLGDNDKECLILPPAVNDTAISATSKNPATDLVGATPYISWSARSSKYKCNEHAVNAAFSYESPLDIVCIGRPSAKIKDTKDHRFHTFGRPVSDKEKMAVFRDAACVVAPSLFEGFGMVPSEALSCGTPVVVYDLPVLRQNYGDRLVYAKWNDEADFIKKVHEVVAHRTQGTKVDLPKSVLEPDTEDVKATFGLDDMKSRIEGFPYHFSKNRQSVTANMICYYGPTVQEAIESVYPYVDEITISYGPTEMWKHVEPDNCLDLIEAYPDTENKIKLKKKDVWQNKREMRQWGADNSFGNRMLIVDADEIYHGLEDWLKYDIIYGCPKWVHFWHDIEHYVVDNGVVRWGNVHDKGIPGTIYNHFRWTHWRNGHRFASNKGTTGIGGDGKTLSDGKHTKQAVEACPNTVIYHLGHVLNPELMKAKHEFYRKRDGDNAGRQNREKAWHSWSGEAGLTKDGLVKNVDWGIPELVVRAFDKLKGEENG